MKKIMLMLVLFGAQAFASYSTYELAEDLAETLLPAGAIQMNLSGVGDGNRPCQVDLVTTEFGFSAYIYVGSGADFSVANFQTFASDEVVEYDLRGGQKVMAQIIRKAKNAHSNDERMTLNVTYRNNEIGERVISKINIIDERKGLFRWKKEIALNCVVD